MYGEFAKFFRRFFAQKTFFNWFKRIALNYLRDWARKDERKPLVLRGARQVGKTTLVKMFAVKFLLKQAAKPSELTNCQQVVSICLKSARIAYYLTL